MTAGNGVGDGGNGWGGRIGAQLGDWGRGTREAPRLTTRAAEPGGGVMGTRRTRSLLTVVVAFGAGLLIGLASGR